MILLYIWQCTGDYATCLCHIRNARRVPEWHWVTFPETQYQNEDLCKTKDTSKTFSFSSYIEEMY